MLKRIFEILGDLLDFLRGRTEFEYKFDAAVAISQAIGLSGFAKGRRAELVSVEVLFSSAPVTSENFTVTLNSHLGTKYSVVLFSQNPSAPAATSIVNIWDVPYPLEDGDELTVAYTNTDTRTVGIRLVGRVR